MLDYMSELYKSVMCGEFWLSGLIRPDCEDGCDVTCFACDYVYLVMFVVLFVLYACSAC